MDNNHTDDYVLVLDDRTEVKNEAEVSKLSVVSDIDEKGKLKTSPAEGSQQSSFLKFNNKDGLLKNFMTNFLKQFNEPKHFSLYNILRKNRPDLTDSSQYLFTQSVDRATLNMISLCFYFE